MRELTVNGMIELADTLNAPPALIINGVDSRKLAEMVQAGIAHSVIVSVADEPLYQVWYHVTADNALHVNGAIQLTNRSNFPALADSIEKLARQLNCASYRFVTSRPGLLRHSVNYGCTLGGVVVSKTL